MSIYSHFCIVVYCKNKYISHKQMLSKRSQTQKVYTIYFHLYKVQKQVKNIYTTRSHYSYYCWWGVGSDKEGFGRLDVPNNNSYVKISQCPVFRENIYMHICTHAFFMFKEQDTKHIIIM